MRRSGRRETRGRRRQWAGRWMPGRKPEVRDQTTLSVGAIDFFYEVIGSFNRGHQYGVLFLTPEHDFDSITKETVELHPCYVPSLHDALRVFPARGDVINYALARLPLKKRRRKRRMHIEEVLMGKWAELVEAYIKSRGEHPKHITLYTWLSPCPRCAKLIIDTYYQLPTAVTKSVVYSADFLNGFSRTDNEYTRQKLRDAGIKVLHVKVKVP